MWTGKETGAGESAGISRLGIGNERVLQSLGTLDKMPFATAQPALRRPVVDLQVRDLVEIDAVACKNS